jgi:hypothetical protein
MDVEKFGLFTVGDPTDRAFTCNICWSRIYEYPFVLSQIVGGSVHNTAWGFEGIHLVFKDWLDDLYWDVVHSDLRPSPLPGTCVWDLTTPPPDEWVNRFDTVLCVSTLEHVTGDHAGIIRDNLLPQVRAGGRLVITFDLPGLQLDQVEGLVGCRMVVPDRPVTPVTSVEPDRTLNLDAGLRVGYLTIRKGNTHAVM